MKPKTGETGHETPMLGICAGIQLISRAFGSAICTMDDPNGEFGFTRLTVCARHPMLRSLEDGFTCMEMHRDGERLLQNFFALY